jgi:predicted transposase YdaD
MHEYDTVLKRLLEKSHQRLTGKRVVRWLPTELPKVQNLRVDLLGEMADGELVQIEVQSTNQPGIGFRMLEYLVHVNRLYGRVPRQILLYVGRDRLRMDSQFQWANGRAGFTLIDMRDVDGEPFVTSPEPSDNVLAILGRLGDQRAALRGILENLSRLERDQTDFYVQSLLILAGLRGLEETVREEAKNVLTIDISENKVLGPAYKRGRQEGLEEGRQEGLEEGRQEGRQAGLQEGQLGLLRRQIESKFGLLPLWVEQRLTQCSSQDLEQIGIRLLGAPTLDEIFR